MDEMIQKMLNPQDPIWVAYDAALAFNLVLMYRLSSELLLMKLGLRRY